MPWGWLLPRWNQIEKYGNLYLGNPPFGNVLLQNLKDPYLKNC